MQDRHIERSFNPRSHMGSDNDMAKTRLRIKVSIHAPTWGATFGKVEVFDSTVVSIHAPTWGATWRHRCSSRTSEGFNPRSHMGSDLLNSIGRMFETFQSTLPHGERLVLLRPPLGLVGFNPRSHMGSDIIMHYDLED